MDGVDHVMLCYIIGYMGFTMSASDVTALNCGKHSLIASTVYQLVT